MSDWKGKTRGNLLGYKIFVLLLKYLPLSVAYFTLRFVAFYFVLFSPTAFKSVYGYFKNIRKSSGLKAVYQIYQNYYVFGQTLLDRMLMFSGLKHPFLYEYINTNSIEKTIKDGESVILIGAHIGNWEVANYLMKNFQCKKINVVFLDAENQKIKDYILKVQGLKKIEIELNPIFLKEDMSHIFEIHNALNNHEVVFIQGDRYLEGGKTISAEFFGHQALFPLSTFQLAARFNYPAYCIFGMKHDKFTYRLYASENIRLKAIELNAKPQPGHILSLYIKELEKMLNFYPTQWFNYFNFWQNVN